MRKPVKNGGVGWDKGCNKRSPWQGGTSLLSKGKPSVTRGRNELVAESPVEGTAKRTGAVPGAASARAASSPKAGSVSLHPHLSSAATGTGWHEHHHNSPCAFTDRHKPGFSVCLFLWLTIDRLYPPAHLQSAYQASSSTLLWQHLLDQGYWTSLALSASSSKPKECSSLGLLLCQPVELFFFSFPTSTMRAWLPQLPLSLLGSFFFPLRPSLVVDAWNLS